MINDYLQKSAQLYKRLTEITQQEEQPDSLQEILDLLDERGLLVEQLKQQGFRYDETNKMHKTLFELDRGIHEKLNVLMDSVKDSIKDLQKAKKVERQYIDPYGDIRQLNARYFDGKK